MEILTFLLTNKIISYSSCSIFNDNYIDTTVTIYECITCTIHMYMYILLIYADVCWYTTDKPDKFPTLYHPYANVPVSQPAGRLQSPANKH